MALSGKGLFYVTSERQERFSQAFPQISVPLGLRQMRSSVVSQKPDSLVPDSLLCRALCQHCGFENLHFTSFSECHHADTYDFICKALSVAQVVAQRNSDRCRKCNSPAKPLFVDYHSLSSDGRDLVLRCFFNGPELCNMSYGLLWWQGDENYTVIGSAEVSSLEPVATTSYILSRDQDAHKMMTDLRLAPQTVSKLLA